MTTLTIKQKMFGTGNIYDIASDLFDREIVFAKDCKYAVVLPSYYGGKGYTTHTSQHTAILKARQLSRQGYSYQILDAQGNRYAVDFDKLSRIEE